MWKTIIVDGKEILCASNLKYIFADANIRLSDQQMEQLEKAHNRALKLKKHNGAFLPGMVDLAARKLRYAYENNLPVNQKAYENCIWNLDLVDIPNPYYIY